MSLEGQTPVALHRVEPACRGGCPAEPWLQARRPEASHWENRELSGVSYHTSARWPQCLMVGACPVATGPSAHFSGALPAFAGG